MNIELYSCSVAGAGYTHYARYMVSSNICVIQCVYFIDRQVQLMN